MKTFFRFATLTLILFSFIGCKAATQNIPVSTDPSGAIVYVDGTETCTTPCNAELEKTQAHILTLQKEGYKQADIQISRKYDTMGVARTAAQSSTWGMNTEGSISNALMSTQAAEQSGDAYVLTPSTVTVKLVKVGQPAMSQSSNPDQDGPIVISSDQLAPEDQQAIIKTTEPATMGDAIANDPTEAAKAALAIGAASAPTIGTKKTLGSSSHTSESFGNGSYTKKTTSTSVKGSVSVNPAEAGLAIIDLLEKNNKESSATE